MYSETTKRILIIIQQDLNNDVFCGRGLLQQRTYHSTIHFWVGSHGFRCSFHQRTVKVTKIKLEPLLSVTGVFEPIDEFKGDIARISYFATRYETTVSGYHILCSTEQPIRYSQLPFLNMLAWNQDPS
jgi:hypothetical protein